MEKIRPLVFLAAFIATTTLAACATARYESLENRIIAAYIVQCKTLEYKAGPGETYIVDPTRNLTERGCPTALIRGWRDGVLIMEKEVEVCECRERHRR